MTTQLRHVRQPNNWGCGLACVAMVAGLEYAEIEQMAGAGLPPVKEGTEPPLLWALTSHLGFSARLLHRANCDTWPVRCGDAHIVQVNFPVGSHWVVWDGEQVLDPDRDGVHALGDYDLGTIIIGLTRIQQSTPQHHA